MNCFDVQILEKIGASNFITPIISGFVGSIFIEKSNINLIVISRKSLKRLGARFWSRGLDEVLIFSRKI